MNPEYFVVGTYNLIRDGDMPKEHPDENHEQQRDGSLLLYKITHGLM